MNSTSNTDGLIPKGDDVYSPPYSAHRICDGKDSTWWGVSPAVKAPYECWVELDLGEAKRVHGTAINEPWNRTEAFQLEYRNHPDEEWRIALHGEKMGEDFSANFGEIDARYWRLHMLKANHDPAIKEWKLLGTKEDLPWRKVVVVDLGDRPKKMTIDISEYIERPGQYLLRFDDLGGGGGRVKSMEGFFDGNKVHEEIITPINDGEMYLLNRHAQVVDESKIMLDVVFAAQDSQMAKIELSIKPVQYLPSWSMVSNMERTFSTGVSSRMVS